MAITKAKKQEIIAEAQAAVEGSQSVVFVNFHGLEVEAVNELRSSLRKEDIGYKVIKKTLLRRVLDANNITGEQPVLEGEIAIAYADDLTAPAREVHAFSKGHADHISIVGGVFDGAYLDQAGMMEIATIPPTPVLRGMFVNIINSPIQSFVIALNAIAEKKSA